MKTYPILFNGAMVRAILSGAKTQTRRPLTPQPDPQTAAMRDVPGENQWWAATARRGEIGTEYTPIVAEYGNRWKSPYGLPGDRLVIRERMRVIDTGTHSIRVQYEADGTESDWLPVPSRLKEVPVIGKCLSNGGYRETWRVTLDVLEVWAERVQEISPLDTLAEGIVLPEPPGVNVHAPPPEYATWTEERQEEWIEGQARAMYFCQCHDVENHIIAFRELWDTIYANKGLGSDENTMNFACKFKLIENLTAEAGEE